MVFAIQFCSAHEPHSIRNDVMAAVTQRATTITPTANIYNCFFSIFICRLVPFFARNETTPLKTTLFHVADMIILH